MSFGARKGANGQDVLIVDVREPDEVALGSIPSSVNLPLSELKDALSPNFGEGDFKKVNYPLPLSHHNKADEQKFAFNKPMPNQNLIFFCRSGKRSATAAEAAGKNGYNNVRNYQGSWLDWSKREKEADNDD
jgi:rhodanese-related sulfurtransferase